MENKNVGYLLLGIAVLFVIITFAFSSTLKEFVDASCTLAHGTGVCPMYETIDKQTYIALGLIGVIIITSLILIFSKQSEKIVVKKIKEKVEKKILDTSELKTEEKQVLKIIQENKTIFQADLIDKTGFGKAKVTRILDRLESREFIERKRRGMTNIVVLKD